ncbi:transcriptional regulator [Pseudomonas sp. 2023EL-01195]|uniref:transcriptional regulator n=1 Tax=Pseudomonas sp. 2023EL-01195 TaxID=3088134 RepID=UPI0003F4DBCE|nr:YdaS family helix-turn-helix protein [Pseudomonas sp. 2023EL-01195]MDW3712918.1 YdaS family helix-turn-helix protein [Pseudomonas sp. 2023EL-01195]
MTLHDYIKALRKDELEVFASRCETSAGQLKQIAYGHRQANPALAINIERESSAAVSCEEMRPDVDWAYLRQSGKAQVA